MAQHAGHTAGKCGGTCGTVGHAGMIVCMMAFHSAAGAPNLLEVCRPRQVPSDCRCNFATGLLPLLLLLLLSHCCSFRFAAAAAAATAAAAFAAAAAAVVAATAYSHPNSISSPTNPIASPSYSGYRCLATDGFIVYDIQDESSR